MCQICCGADVSFCPRHAEKQTASQTVTGGRHGSGVDSDAELRVYTCDSVMAQLYGSLGVRGGVDEGAVTGLEVVTCTAVMTSEAFERARLRRASFLESEQEDATRERVREGQREREREREREQEREREREREREAEKQLQAAEILRKERLQEKSRRAEGGLAQRGAKGAGMGAEGSELAMRAVARQVAGLQKDEEVLYMYISAGGGAHTRTHRERERERGRERERLTCVLV